jgi:hypothetical protein
LSDVFSAARWQGWAMSTGRAALHSRRPLRRLRVALMALGACLLVAILIAVLVDRIFFRSSSSPAGTGSGVAATQPRSLPPFTGIDLAGSNNVVVAVGTRQLVVVHADDNLLGRVTTRVRSGRLEVGTTAGNLNAKSPMYVTVSVPSLDRIRLRGNGNIAVTGVNSRRLTVALPGNGNIQAAGAVTRLVVTISGAGNAELRQVIARDARAALNGDGSIMLTATHRLTAKVSGRGTILYRGDPAHVAQRVTGTGAITVG